MKATSILRQKKFMSLRAKARLDIQLVYSQGMRKLITANVDYTINQTTYFLQMAARGSAFCITASYPVLLSNRKNKEE